ncbi:MAG: hypothetical protein HRT88_18130, partial [Lentisphaeraceae bacterium]|nr:hypothetical protein [Lentisphaeraceae bacterium]
ARAKVNYAADEPEMLKKVVDVNYKAKVERIITFAVEAFDWNCPKYITQRYTPEEFGLMD